MKIAIVSQGIPTSRYPLNGVFEFDQAKALAKAGIEVALIAIDFRSGKFKRKYGLMEYESEGVSIFELSLPIGVYRRALPILQMLLLIPFKAMLKTFGKPQIVHAHFYSIAAIACKLKKKYDIPFIVTEHSSKLNKPIQGISKLDQRLAKKAYRYCDQLICVSKALSDNIFNNFGKNSVIIPNMVDDSVFECHDATISTEPFVFVSVGSLKPIKSFDKLIDAFAKLKGEAKLFIIGDGTERRKLTNQIIQLGLKDHVHLLGQLERCVINQVFQKSHAFVLASKSETFGVSYIEAMYAGLPVIATRCGGPESFVDKSNGLLVPVDDEQALIQALEDMRRHYTAFDRLGISQTCHKRFSPTTVANEIIKTYQSKLGF